MSDQEQALPYEQILASLPHGLCVVDGEGKIVYLNPALQEMLGWQPAAWQGQLLSQRLQEMIDDPALALCWNVAVSEALANGQTTFLNLSADLHTEREDRPLVSATAVAAPWRDEDTGQSGALFLLCDSARQQNLEGVRQRFLSVVSHELGSPLTNISAAAERVSRLLNGGNTEEWHLLQIICSETARLRRLLGQFLSRPPAPAAPGRTERSVVTLRPLLYRVAHTFGVRESEHELKVQAPADLPFVWGDADKIQEVLSNLVDNALRYSPPGTEITLAAERWADSVLVSVTNRGRNIAADDEARLFEPLYRDNHGQPGHEGLGLGLYICRTLVQALGGELWHEGLADGGTRFCFTLPRVEGRRRKRERGERIGGHDPDRRG